MLAERRMKRATNQLLSKGETKASRRACNEVGRHSRLGRLVVAKGDEMG